MYVKTDNNNKILSYPYTLDMFRNDHKNVSLPKSFSNSFMARFYVFPVYEAVTPEFDGRTQFVTSDHQPIFQNNTWTISWIVNDKTPEQIEIDIKAKSNEVRKERDRLLAECDWVVIKAIDTGSPVDPEWAAYRQLLRDIAAQDGFPWVVEWPNKP